MKKILFSFKYSRNLPWRSSFPVESVLVKLQHEFSCICVGTFDLECIVEPFTRSFETTALIAIPNATNPSLLTADKSVFNTKVFPVPPDANIPPSSILIASRTALKKVVCS